MSDLQREQASWRGSDMSLEDSLGKLSGPPVFKSRKKDFPTDVPSFRFHILSPAWYSWFGILLYSD